MTSPATRISAAAPPTAARSFATLSASTHVLPDFLCVRHEHDGDGPLAIRRWLRADQAALIAGRAEEAADRRPRRLHQWRVHQRCSRSECCELHHDGCNCHASCMLHGGSCDAAHDESGSGRENGWRSDSDLDAMQCIAYGDGSSSISSLLTSDRCTVARCDMSFLLRLDEWHRWIASHRIGFVRSVCLSLPSARASLRAARESSACRP